MHRNPYKEGRRVYWYDPGCGECSAPGVITRGVPDDDYADAVAAVVASREAAGLSTTVALEESIARELDNIICIVNDAGGEIEALAHELDLSCVSTGIHHDVGRKVPGLTFGFGEPDDHGYFDIGDTRGARDAEKRDGVPVGSYWPFN